MSVSRLDEIKRVFAAYKKKTIGLTEHEKAETLCPYI